MLHISSDIVLPVNYCTSGRFISTNVQSSHPHRRLDTFVLLLCTEGKEFIEQNMTEHILEPGSFMILLRDFEHKGTRPCAPGTSYYWCHFSLSSPYTLIDGDEADRTSHKIFTLCDRNSVNLTDTKRVNSILLPECGRVNSTERYRLLFRSLIDRSRSTDLYKAHTCDLLITELLFELSNDYIMQKEAPFEKKQLALAAKVVEYIRTDAAAIKGAGEVAARFGYNAEYLTTVVKKSTGLSIIEHINRGKIEEAKKLLINTDLAVSEIAPLCGVQDPKYFSRLFVKLTDTTPLEYRNAYFRIHTVTKNRIM